MEPGEVKRERLLPVTTRLSQDLRKGKKCRRRRRQHRLRQRPQKREGESAEAKWLKQCRKFSRGLTIHEMICISKCPASRQTNGTHGELKSFSSAGYLHARCKYDHAVGPEKKVAGSFSKMAPGWIFGQVFRVILEIEDVDRDRERVGAKQKQRDLLRPFFVRPHFTRERVPFQFLKD